MSLNINSRPNYMLFVPDKLGSFGFWFLIIFILL